MSLNEMFVFPFEKIPQGANIAIYGFGSVGKCYYNQVKKSGYCNITLIVDKRVKFYEDTKYIVIPPEDIQDNAFDYIVIAINSNSVAHRIRNTLLSEYHVKKEKIVYVPNRKIPIQISNAGLNDILHDEEILKRELHIFFASKYGNIDFFSNIIDEMASLYNEHKTNEVKMVREYFEHFLMKEKSEKIKIVILRILYHAGYFCENYMEMYCKSIFTFSDYDTRTWLLYDISVMERNNQYYRHKNFYLDKRKIMEENAFYYYGNKDLSKKNVRENNNKVAIITFGLGNKSSSHNGLIVPYANEMNKKGRKVAIFVVDLLRYRYGECFIQPIEPIEQDSEEYSIEHTTLFCEDIQIFYNDGEDIRERVINFINKLNKYSPDIVYDFCGEYSFLSPLFCKMYPTVALPMRGYVSSACFDIYMCRNKSICLKENKYYNAIKEQQMVEGLICSEPQSAILKLKKSECGLKEKSFVIVTVGNRLKTELTKDFVDCVCEFLNLHDDAYWILVGEKISGYIKKYLKKYFTEKRIIEWGYESDLIGFYAICDVYWNPNRMGAGGSIGSAMRCGIPIVTTDFPSDVLPRLGKENAVSGGYEECRKMVEALYQDPKLYQEKSTLMKKRMEISGIPEYVQLLLDTGDSLLH